MRTFVAVGTGLIYAAIVAAWAAYLVPLWLRRQDELAASRREGQAIGARVLERRTPTEARNGHAAEPHGDAPSDEPWNEVTDHGGEDIEDAVTGPAADQARPRGRSAAARRRRTLFVLLLTTTLVAILAAAAVVSWWWIAVAGGSVVAFLVASAVAVRRARQRVRLDTHLGEPAPDEADLGDDAGVDEHLSGQERAAVSDGESAAEGAEREHDNDDSWRGADGLWDPIPVPLPTYVTKAKAPRTVRTIDLADSDVQSSGRLPEAEMLDRPADSPGDVVEATESTAETAPHGAEAEAEAERRRAVGD